MLLLKLYRIIEYASDRGMVTAMISTVFHIGLMIWGRVMSRVGGGGVLLKRSLLS